MLYGPSHEAVLRYARQHVAQPGRVLDSAAALACWPQGWEPPSPGAGEAGLSTGVIRRAAAARVGLGTGFAAGCAEELPFAGAVFGLVVVTLSMSRWCDVAPGSARSGG